MRRFFRAILQKPVLWIAKRYSSRPVRDRVFNALTALREKIMNEPGERGVIKNFGETTGRFIIFSDQHKGTRNGADDFIQSEPNYLAALDHYYHNEFTLVSLGDCEELWENSLTGVKKHNQKTFEAEKKFHEKGCLIKVFGNHDLFWDNDPLAGWQLKNIYGEGMKVYEGVILECRLTDRELRIFCTHGHQGDNVSDGNWFSKFFISKIWAPLQAYLSINPNTPAYNDEKKTLHNELMYEWASTSGMLLVTGHTHQPVFASLTHLERLYHDYQVADAQDAIIEKDRITAEIRKIEKYFTAVSVDYMNMKPCYFNTGCCCFNDGDITGIEIDEGFIRLIKWELAENPRRVVLQESRLSEINLA